MITAVRRAICVGMCSILYKINQHYVRALLKRAVATKVGMLGNMEYFCQDSLREQNLRPLNRVELWFLQPFIYALQIKRSAYISEVRLQVRSEEGLFSLKEDEEAPLVS